MNCQSPDPNTIGSIAALSELVEAQFKDDKSTTVLYRGHGAASFDLRPKIGRLLPPAHSGKTTVNETLMLELFRRQSTLHLEIVEADDWELLAIAQHHGLGTRLLDWTRNPLVALYFAVCIEYETRDKDGCPKRENAEIIAWRCPKKDLAEPLPKCGPLGIEGSLRYIPRVVTPRLRAQSGVFTVHSNPTSVFCPDEKLARIQVPYAQRKSLKDSLFRHGVHEGVIFPDLDGLARHIQWCQTKSY